MKLYVARWVDSYGIKCHTLPQPLNTLGNLYNQIKDNIKTGSWIEEYKGEVTQDQWDNILEHCKG